MPLNWSGMVMHTQRPSPSKGETAEGQRNVPNAASIELREVLKSSHLLAALAELVQSEGNHEFSREVHAGQTYKFSGVKSLWTLRDGELSLRRFQVHTPDIGTLFKDTMTILYKGEVQALLSLLPSEESPHKLLFIRDSVAKQTVGALRSMLSRPVQIDLAAEALPKVTV